MADAGEWGKEEGEWGKEAGEESANGERVENGE
jgi:hypothetical protein